MKQRKDKLAGAPNWAIVHLRAFALCALACIAATAQGQSFGGVFQEGVSANGMTTFTFHIEGGVSNEVVFVQWFQPPNTIVVIPIDLLSGGTFNGDKTVAVGAQPGKDVLILSSVGSIDICAATWSTELVRAPTSILWDQSDYDEGVNAFVDQVFDDFPDFDSYLVNDVDTGGDAWVIDSVMTFFTNGNDWANADVTQGRLNIFPKTGDLPDDGADDPGAGQVVDIVIIDLGDTMAVLAGGLNIELDPGEYWVGLTPLANFGAFGQEFHRGAPISGVDTAWRNPGGGFGLGGDWSTTAPLAPDWIDLFDAAITITGEIGNGNDCPWDLDGSGDVGTNDLILLLGSWGNPYGTKDLIRLLGAWGDCP